MDFLALASQLNWCYLFFMNELAEPDSFIVPVDEDHARMMAYALSPEGQARIDAAQAEIDAGKGIVADETYFKSLKERRIKLATQT